MAKSILVGKKPTNYEVKISDKPISKKDITLATKAYKKILVLSDDGVPRKYIQEITKCFKSPKKVHVQILKAGERSKSFKTLQDIHQNLALLKFDRTDCIIAIGGGVIGDISGFAASTYLRGIDFIQIPTTLLAMVDSSVGGKTAINIPQGKNLVGAFYNPKKVFISLAYLQTLNEKEYKSGLGEVVKYAFILNKKLFRILEANAGLVMSRNLKVLENIIYESIQTKAKIVTKDEKENGVRALLNFGHTFGHAIEAKNNYKNISHGEAVILGMGIASQISHLENFLSKKDLLKINNLISELDLNANFRKYKYSELKPFLMNDKKVAKGKLNLILLKGIGSAFKTDEFDKRNLSKAFNF